MNGNQDPARRASAPLLSVILIVCAAAALGSCSFFGATAFSPDLTLLQAQYDLSSVISEGQSDSVIINAVDVGASRLVIVRTNWQDSQAPMVVLDGALNLIRSFSRSEVSFSGPMVMTDAGSPTRVVIGNTVYHLDDAQGLVADRALNPPITGQRWEYGFAIIDTAYPVNNRNLTNFQTNGSVLYYCGWYADWTYIGQGGVNIDSASLEKWDLGGVFSDPDERTATFLFIAQSDKSFHYVTIPWNDLITGFAGDLLSSYPGFTRPGTPIELLGFTKGSTGTGTVPKAFVGFRQTDQNDSKNGVFTRFFGDADLQESFPYSHLPDIRAAYPLAGDAFYTYDRDTRKISRMAAWWN